MNILSQKVLRYRQAHNLSQAEFADKVGISGNQISRMENGLLTKRAGSLKRVKAFFDLLETNRVEPTINRINYAVLAVPRKTHKKYRRVKKQVFLARTDVTKPLTQDPLSLKIVSELKSDYRLLVRLTLVGFGILGVLILLK